MRFQLAKCIKLNMQTVSAITFRVAKLCQAENERFGRNSFSKSETVSNRTDLKPKFLKIFQKARLSQTEKISQAARTQNTKNQSKRETLKNLSELSKLKNCQCLKMFQVATEILATT